MMFSFLVECFSITIVRRFKHRTVHLSMTGQASLVDEGGRQASQPGYADSCLGVASSVYSDTVGGSVLKDERVMVLPLKGVAFTAFLSPKDVKRCFD